MRVSILFSASVHILLIGALVVLESKKRSVSSEGQKWLREVPNKSGWFRLKNPYSGKVLTAQNATITSITGKI